MQIPLLWFSPHSLSSGDPSYWSSGHYWILASLCCYILPMAGSTSAAKWWEKNYWISPTLSGPQGHFFWVLLVRKKDFFRVLVASVTTTAILLYKGSAHVWGLNRAGLGELFKTRISPTTVLQGPLSSASGQGRRESFLVTFMSIATDLGCPKGRNYVRKK